MATGPIVSVMPAGFPWQVEDPFLVCVHHDDAYPAGNAELGPAASLAGRRIGEDFEGKDGWRMYHGEVVPGFPSHPHRGFETVTIMRRGFIDHADSLGAAARFGPGDVQWITAGAGIQHAEMFPLLKGDAPNPLELFQIWVNLPHEKKLCPPHFQMFWRPDVPVVETTDEEGRHTLVDLVAGSLEGEQAKAPPPESWAARPGSGVCIWLVHMSPGARWTLPAAPAGVRRTLFFYEGDALRAADREIPANSRIALDADSDVPLVAGEMGAELLYLAGRPIAEPVAQYGPFVMCSRAELEQAFEDYRRTRFGGWPWDRSDPVHPRDEGRFARFPDGRVEPGR